MHFSSADTRKYHDPISWLSYAYENIEALKDYHWPTAWGHPEDHGFEETIWALNRQGKTADWVCSIEGYGRLHAQFIYGQWYLHHDQYDPAQKEVVEHLVKDAGIPPWVIGVGIFGATMGTLSFIAKIIDEA